MSTYCSAYVQAITDYNATVSGPRDPNPSGLCMCGCGQQTRVRKNGKRRGHHSRFVLGHAQKRYAPEPMTPELKAELDAETALCREVYLRVTGRRRQDRREFYRYRQRAWARDGGTCSCGAPGVEVHHIHPLHLGGDNSLDNLITLCWACHREAHRQITKDRKRAGRLDVRTALA